MPVVFIDLVHANILSTAVEKLTICKCLHSGQTVTWQVSITDASSSPTVTQVKPVMDVNLNGSSFVVKATIFCCFTKGVAVIELLITFILITCHSINQRQPKLDLTYCKQSTINPCVHRHTGMDCVMNEWMNEWLMNWLELALNAPVLCREEKKKKNSRYWKKRRSMTLMLQSMLLADYKQHLTKTLQSFSCARLSQRDFGSGRQVLGFCGNQYRSPW